MNLLIIHRRYRLRGGEDSFIYNTLVPHIQKMGVNYHLEILPPLFEKGSFLTGIIEMVTMVLGLEKLRPSFFKIKKLLSQQKPTHVLFNNFVPTVSLKAPSAAKEGGAKTLWWIHNARLSCANGLLFNGKDICHRCLTQGSRYAFFQKCFSTFSQSFFYALVYRFHRVVKNVGKDIDIFVTSSHYTVKALDAAFQQVFSTLPRSEVIYLPASAKSSSVKKINTVSSPFVLFLGRISFEKGADIYIQMAAKIPEVTFVLAGTGPMEDSLKALASKNVKFVGSVSDDERAWLFSNAEALVVPSRVPENASLVILESHSFGIPVIYPKGGGAEEMVKWLQRSGCTVDDYKGQKFEKKAGLQRDFDQDFINSFRSILK